MKSYFNTSDTQALVKTRKQIKDSLQICKTPETIKELREIVEIQPAFFYFDREMVNHPTFYRNLIALNPFLNIDDLLYEILGELNDNSIIKKNSFTTDRLQIFNCILQNKILSRPMLKYLFENILYNDFKGINLFYKYSILNKIILQYKASDDISKEKSIDFQIEEKIQEIIKDEEKYLLNYKKLDINLFNYFSKEENIGKNNVMVLSNLIWENTFYILKNYTEKTENEYLVFSNEEKRCFEGKEMIDYEEWPLLDNFGDESEIVVILSLYSTIVNCTGIFFENRILRNSEIFLKLKKNVVFRVFYESCLKNFDKKRMENGFKIIKKN